MEWSPEDGKSIFHSGFAKLIRIDRIRKRIIECRMTDDWENWVDALSCWCDELEYKMTEEQRKECAAYEKLFEDHENTINLRNRFIYNKLKSYTRLLGRLEYEFGLGMPDTESSEFAADIV